MGLVCVECERNIGPSESLPGREGSLVHPVVPALIWTPELGKAVGASVEAQKNLSLCLECIDQHTPAERRSALDLVYQAIRAETTYQQARKQGSFKDEVSHEHVETMKAVATDICLQCEAKTPAPPHPFFFKIRPLDRVTSSSYDSRFWGQSYNLGDLTEGLIEFPICFDCFRPSYPRLFRALSDYLLNQDSLVSLKDQTYIHPSALAEAQQNPGAADIIRRIVALDDGDPHILPENPTIN